MGRLAARAAMGGAAVMLAPVFVACGSDSSTNYGVTDGQWSPDGRALLFSSDHSGNLEIYVRKGGAIHRLTEDDGTDSEASWSPDGRRIAFQRGHDEDDDLYVMDADGSDVVQLTNDKFGKIVGKAAWSPDGKQVLYTAEYCLSTLFDFCSTTIERIRSDGAGGRPREVGRENDAFPDWSRTGLIVFESEAGLAVSRPDGRRRRLLGPGGTNPVWSPDGSRIAYACDEGICTVGAQGGDVRVITSTQQLAGLVGDELDYSLDWSPDGRILFAHGPFYYSEPWHLYVVRANGRGLHRLALDMD